MEAIKIPTRIYRSFIIEHKELNFIYSSDYLQKAFFGQQYDAHGEPNTYPVPTLFKWCSNPVYFQQGNDLQKIMIDECINSIPLDKPIIPFPKIGCGHSRMWEFAPDLYKYLHEQIDKIKYPNIVYYVKDN